MAERIKLSDFEEKVLNSSVPVLIDFYSDSCVPCTFWRKRCIIGIYYC